MKRNVCALCALLLLLVLHYGCSSEESSRIMNNGGFQLSMDGDVTRSPENEAILDNMSLYCFTQGSNPVNGDGGSWNSEFSHQLLGITRTDMTLHTKYARTGLWDLVMVSPDGATLSPPVDSKNISEALMYTYDPGAVQGDGSRSMAHEIWHRLLRLPEITTNNTASKECAISRNMAMVRVIVDRAVDIDMASTAEHKLELHNVPNKISWAGTLLRTVSPGVYETSLTNPDVLPDPLTGKFTFEDNSAVETGTYKSDVLTFIIPAHREADFWANNTTQNNDVQDILQHKMSISVSFTKASGGKFEKTADISHAHLCNRILEVHIRMKDVNLELETSVKDWDAQAVPADFGAPYLNVSDVETTVYDGAASRIYFWSNQPNEEVYVLKEGDGISDVNTVFYDIAGPTAVNRHYDLTSQSGYIDIANLDMGTSDAKIYLKAGSLQREITVKRSVSAQMSKNITTPYVGTFHKGSQVGERLVTWNYTGPWTAYIDNVASGSQVVIDRLPSPAFSDGTLYRASPSDAEMGVMSNEATSVTGMNNIYFRVGWKGTTAVPRYATITVRKGTNETGGEIIQTLYLRQGEMASAVFNRSNNATSARFSPYNLTSTSWNMSIDVNGGTFTNYPTQCGSYFQWMDEVNPRYAYDAITSVPGSWSASHPFCERYWTGESPVVDEVYEICPENYRRVSDGAVTGESTGGATSELRQSLWKDPTAATATNTLSGYYADGFFDRGAIISSPTEEANSAVGSGGSQVAYKGRLFYNDDITKASLFFPAAGQRAQSNGLLSETGSKGYYWTATSTINTTQPSGSTAYISTRLRNTAVNIRCVAK